MTVTENPLTTQEGCVTTIKRGLDMLVNSDSGLEELMLGLSFYLEMAQQARFSSNIKELKLGVPGKGKAFGSPDKQIDMQRSDYSE